MPLMCNHSGLCTHIHGILHAWCIKIRYFGNNHVFVSACFPSKANFEILCCTKIALNEVFPYCVEVYALYM